MRAQNQCRITQISQYITIQVKKNMILHHSQQAFLIKNWQVRWDDQSQYHQGVESLFVGGRLSALLLPLVESVQKVGRKGSGRCSAPGNGG